MKRSELTVGQRVYLDSSRDWETLYPWDKQVEIVSTVPLFRGNEVRVVPIRRDGTVGSERRVQLAHLRGEYESTAARVKANRDARDALLLVHEDDRKVRVERAEALAKRVSVLTGGPAPHVGYQGRIDYVDLDALEKLVELAEGRSIPDWQCPECGGDKQLPGTPMGCDC